jgi:hypothetical protein
MGTPFNVSPSSSVTDSGSGASTVSNIDRTYLSSKKDAVVDKTGDVVGGVRKTVAEDLNYFKNQIDMGYAKAKDKVSFLKNEIGALFKSNSPLTQGASGFGVIGATAVVLGSIYTAYKTWDFYSGRATDKWNKKGYQVPNRIFYKSKDGVVNDGSGVVVPSIQVNDWIPPEIADSNYNESYLRVWFDWKKQKVVWENQRLVGAGTTLHEEPMDTFVERNNVVPMDGKALTNIPYNPNIVTSKTIYKNWKAVQDDVYPALEGWKEENTRVILMQDGLMFTGTSIEGSKHKNSTFVPWSEIGSADEVIKNVA